ncbi:mdis1-interacting receptor like kinase 2 [Quercus suber]|uniref:non-specific serine/threonine protein kinase n=1 Tax=Quercus suber TaxID=58331 RepID=A0AAW0LHQ0_QUESU
MASKVSISVLVVSWVLCVFMHSTNMFIGAASVAASESSLEAKALRESGWWTHQSNEKSLNHCDNNLTGHFPLFLTNLTQLEYLFIYQNLISRPIPKELGNLTYLWYLDLSSNMITGSIPDKLGDLKNLQILVLENNKLTRLIASALSNFTDLHNMTSLYLDSNQFNGSIPLEIGNMKSLKSLDLSNSHIFGEIPSTIGHLTNLSFLSLSWNQINGSIPIEIANCSSLDILSLSHNHLTRSIPSQFINLMLHSIDLSDSNQFNGSIPLEIGNMKSLKSLDLSNSHIFGEIPSTIGHLTNLSFLSLSWNQINGSIPIEIANCSSLDILSLSHNHLTRSIPSQFINLMLHSIDLSYNNLTGTIPLYLVNTTFNLSYNSLKGQISNIFQNHSFDAFIGNKDLCGDIKSFSPCHPSSQIMSKIKLLITVPIFIALLLVYFFYSRCWVEKTQFNPSRTKNGDLFSIWNFDGKIAYEDIIEVTKDFDISYCIGTGGYGSVYKAQLPSGKVVALKKLHRLEAEDPTFDKSFENKIKMLTEIRHRNIVKLHGYCLHKWCVFLVYQYMERGSLFCILSNDVEGIELDWTKRVNIIKSIAHALSYMHHECIPVIIHCDISSNNILLNSEFEAFVTSNHTEKYITFLNSFHLLSYAELAYTMAVTEKCDVYSFGIY